MTRSSNYKLFTPYENLEREFRSSRRHFKTLSLDETITPRIYLFSDLEDYSKEEEEEPMAETIEQYMSKTRTDYGSGVARPKIEDKDSFELKERFRELLMKCPQHYLTGIQEHNGTSRERSTETSDGLAAIQAQLNNLRREIKKVNEKLYAAQVGFDLGASVSVMPLLTYLNLGLDELGHTKLTVELADRTVKYPKGIAENLDLEARLMGETLVLNRSLNPILGDYIELNDLNVPIELRGDQANDLMPTIDEDEVIKEFRARNDARMINEIFRYPSDHDHDKKIHMDYAYNLKFSCMIVLEDIDDYRDEEMGDVIFGEPFLNEVGINARRFDGIITIYNGDEEAAYQMVRSHPRFKHLTNEQCNKIPPLLKLSVKDISNE
ncbi:hypothetical protein Tco_0601483 [Tanacetum coccineum]